MSDGMSSYRDEMTNMTVYRERDIEEEFFVFNIDNLPNGHERVHDTAPKTQRVAYYKRKENIETNLMFFFFICGFLAFSVCTECNAHFVQHCHNVGNNKTHIDMRENSANGVRMKKLNRNGLILKSEDRVTE